MTTIAVVVPSFRRHDELARCLAAISSQRRAPDEVVVVTRRDDPSAAEVAMAARCRVVTIDEPGVLAAMGAGAEATTSDVVCFTDDDAVAPPEWLERLEATFAGTELVGGVGGRDVVFDGETAREDGERTADVGRTTWYGRHVGGHHLGAGPARDVSFLKGVNAAYRRDALGLPQGLRGSGAQAHFEVAVGRYATTRGYRLVYDPEITVDHHPAERQGDDQRGGPAARAVSDAAYNLVVATGGVAGLVRVAYATVVGDRGAPGMVRAVVALAQRDGATVRRLVPSVRGSLAGGWAIVTGRSVTYAIFD